MLQPCPAHVRSFITRFRVPVLLMRSGRPFSSIIAGALSMAAVWIHSGFSTRAVLVGLAMSVATMFGFVINDILDYDKDAAAGVQRPIAMGVLSRPAALVFSLFLVLVVWTLSTAVGSGRNVLAVTTLALLLYTPFARRMPLLKGAYVACLCTLPLSYASAVDCANPSWQAYVVLALWIVGRETLMDAHEIEGDRKAGMMTPAVALGQVHARRLGVAIMIVATMWLIGVARGLFGKSLAIVSIMSLLCVLLWPQVEEDRRIAFSRLPMLAAALAVANG
jgi:4-hydroxybenzoate polyprenyltransferase